MDLINYELEDSDAMKNKFLTFLLDNESYGLEMKYVIEIINLQTITEMPGLPSYIKGIISLRGKVIPIMDARLKFKKEYKDYNERTCIVIIEIEDTFVGLVVDAVAEVISIPEENLVAPPRLNTSSSNNYLKSIAKINDGLKLIIDCNKLINEYELDDLKDAL